MSTTAPKQPKDAATDSPWDGFRGALWQREINVRAFIQLNYTPYDGDSAFLAPATERTTKVWGKLTTLFVEERKKGVLDISQVPSSITAHAPGYIDGTHVETTYVNWRVAVTTFCTRLDGKEYPYYSRIADSIKATGSSVGN
jgi:pyruvate-formate lyase